MRPSCGRYVLFVLTLVNILNYLDSFVMVLLLQPIKEDLRLSDTQLGFLTGLAFALFYATLGLPIARWADRGNRARITAIAIGTWGVTVMSVVFVRTYAQLVLARVVAGVGESGCLPPTYSLLADYFPESAARTRAMATFWLAPTISSLIGFLAGGWLQQRIGWRGTLFVIGIPGLLLAALIMTTIAEPRARGSFKSGLETPPLQPRWTMVLDRLWGQRSSRHLALALVLLWTMGSGMTPWYAAFLVRSHGMSVHSAGNALGIVFGTFGIMGILLGGQVASRFFAHNEVAQMRLSALTVATLVPLFALFLLLPSTNASLGALAPLVIANGVFIGPAFTLLQRLVTTEMRATTLALVMLFANLIGAGLGPQAVGILSDLLQSRLGSESLRYAMLALSFVAFWSAYHFWQVGRYIDVDLEGQPI